jgi:hypothetical protein
MLKISFENNSTTKKFILSLIGKKVNGDGVITNKDGTPVIDIDGNEITLEEFGLVASGSEIFVKDNVTSLFKYHDKYGKE